MIILDETRLSQDTLARIGKDYGMEMQGNTVLDYDVYVEEVIDRFYFDIDEFKDRLINAIMNGIKINFKLK